MNALQFWSVLLFAMLLIGSCTAAFLAKNKVPWIVIAVISAFSFMYLLGTIFLVFEVKNPFVAQTISADEIAYDRSSEKPDCVTCGFDKKDLIAPEAQIPSQQQQIIVNNGSVAENPVTESAKPAAVSDAPAVAAEQSAVKVDEAVVPDKASAKESVEKAEESTVSDTPAGKLADVSAQMSKYYYINAGGQWTSDKIDTNWMNSALCENPKRAWQALNPNPNDQNANPEARKNAPWVHLFCSFVATDDIKMDFIVPIKYHMAAQELKFIFALDNAADKQFGTYDVFLAGDPNLKSGAENYSKQISVYFEGQGEFEGADGQWHEIKEWGQYPLPKGSTTGIIFHFRNFEGDLWLGSTELLNSNIHNEVDLPVIELKK